jgi:predicted neuraminidase
MYTDGPMNRLGSTRALESGAWPLLSLAAVISAFVAAFVDGPSTPASRAFAVEATSPSAPLPVLEGTSRIVSAESPPSVHSATAVEISGGRLRAFWYGGTREGAKDVALYSAVFDPSSSAWSPQAIVTTREETASDLGRYVKKLGNPVAARDGEGRLWLFYVSVSLGGWSGSAVNYRISEDEGASFGPAHRLVSSPLLNVGTLVRGPAISFEDGTVGLPVYHELLGKFGELLRITPEGEVLEKLRLSHGRSSLQPVVVPLGRLDAVAFLRSSGGSPKRVLSTRTADGGRTWSDLVPTALPNPDAAIAAVRARGGALVIAYNESEVDRSNLKIAVSRDDGRTFAPLSTVDPPEPSRARELAYPWLLESSDGSLHLLYSWNRSRIVHVHYPAQGSKGLP